MGPRGTKFEMVTDAKIYLFSRSYLPWRQLELRDRIVVLFRMSSAGGRGGRLPGIGRNDRSLRSDGIRGRGSSVGRGVSGRGAGQDRDRALKVRAEG
jgi:hypothetical protein